MLDVMTCFGLGELLLAIDLVAAKPVSCSLVLQDKCQCLEVNLGKVPSPLASVYEMVCHKRSYRLVFWAGQGDMLCWSFYGIDKVPTKNSIQTEINMK